MSVSTGSMSVARRWIACGLVGALCLGAFAVPASAGDTEDTIPGLQADFKALKKSKDIEGASRLAARTAVLFDTTVDKKQRKSLIKLVSKVPSIKKSDKLVHAALEAIGEMGDAGGAKFVKKYLRLRGKEDASETLKIAIQTAAKLPDAGLVGPLLALFEKAKNTGVRRMAAESLSHFGSVKRYRAKILDALVSELKKLKPGGPGRNSSGGSGGGGVGGGTGGYGAPGGADLDAGSGGYGDSGGPGAVWNALSGVMPRYLNRLTGQSVTSMDMWFGVYDNNKRKLDNLFSDDE